MSQNPPGAHEQAKPRQQTMQQKAAPLIHHNPVTQQMLIVGKRRETAEALLAQRLQERRTA